MKLRRKPLACAILLLAGLLCLAGCSAVGGSSKSDLQVELGRTLDDRMECGGTVGLVITNNGKKRQKT